jgi:hypothetical protein
MLSVRLRTSSLLIDVVVSISDSDSFQRSEYPGSNPGSASFLLLVGAGEVLSFADFTSVLIPLHIEVSQQSDSFVCTGESLTSGPRHEGAGGSTYSNESFISGIEEIWMIMTNAQYAKAANG